MTLRTTRVDWRPCWRVLPDRFPPILLFERVADAADLDAVLEVESLTNPRVRVEVGALHLVGPDERVSGPGTSAVMAAFTHLDPAGSRFSDGTYGVFHARRELETAVVESWYHRERFLRATAEGPLEIDMRAHGVDLRGDLHDLRGRRADYPEVYAERDHAAGRRLGLALREDGSDGIAHDSVRRPGGECAAVFRPKLLSRVRRTRHLCLSGMAGEWPGSTRSASCPRVGTGATQGGNAVGRLRRVFSATSGGLHPAVPAGRMSLGRTSPPLASRALTPGRTQGVPNKT